MSALRQGFARVVPTPVRALGRNCAAFGVFLGVFNGVDGLAGLGCAEMTGGDIAAGLAASAVRDAASRETWAEHAWRL